jgi:hypothetical protein
MPFLFYLESGIGNQYCKSQNEAKYGIRNQESGTNFNPNKNNTFYHLIGMEFGTQKHNITVK